MDVFGWFGENQGAINGLVGVVTLIGAGWATLRIFLLRRVVDRQAGAVSKRSVFSVIADLGIGPYSRIDEAASVRVLNVLLFCIMSVALVWVVIGVFQPLPLAMMVTEGVAFLLCLSAMALNAAGRRDAARFLCILVVVGYYFAILLAVGPRHGIEYFLPALAILPILIFSRRESRKMWAATSIVGLMLLTTLVFAPHIEPMVTLPENVHTFGYYGGMGMLTVITFVSVNYYNFHSVRFFSDLEKEKAQADTLLLDVFPPELVRQLRGEHNLIARSHGEATILHAQISGLAELFQRVSAVHVVEILDQLFSEFDKLADEHKIRKIKTFGGIYIAASGLADADQGDPDAVARFAIAMRARARELSAQAGYPVDIRIGIATGQVISGVIGRSRPSLDIWGETVQLADALVHGPFDEAILVNEPTYWRIKQHFHLSPATQEGWGLPDGDSSYLLVEEILN